MGNLNELIEKNLLEVTRGDKSIQELLQRLINYQFNDRIHNKKTCQKIIEKTYNEINRNVTSKEISK